jgi:alpha-1,6-mannosyltransferase
VCTTNYAAAEFERIQAQNVKMIPLGVDLSRFSPELADLAFRRNLVGDQKMVVACTRLSKEKDPDFLLDIAAEFKQQKLPITLVIAGSGPMERQLYSRVAEDQLPVKFLGFIQDSIQIAKILASSDVFLAVGPIETFGLAALESLACGTPVISRLGGAISEITSEDCAKSLVRDEKA